MSMKIRDVCVFSRQGCLLEIWIAIILGTLAINLSMIGQEHIGKKNVRRVCHELTSISLHALSFN